MARNKHIRPEHIDAVVNAIHTWDRGKLTWEHLSRIAEPIVGYRPSRSGLSAHPEIQSAFSARQKTLRQKPAGAVPSPGSLADASRMIAARDSEISALKQQVTDLREKLDRWRYNAMLLNITIDKLDRPLPPISRAD